MEILRSRECILSALRDMGIAFDLIEHAPAHTIQECAGPARRLGAVIPINLFLRPRRHEKYYLLLASPLSRFNASQVSPQVPSPRLCFAAPEELFRCLLAQPGSASPLELLFPEARNVTLLIDRRLEAEPRLAFHPGRNDASLAMRQRDFLEVFLPRVGKTPLWVDMEEESP